MDRRIATITALILVSGTEQDARMCSFVGPRRRSEGDHYQEQKPAMHLKTQQLPSAM
jgi:hypothetical protein